jgi:predicted chitinase
MVYIKEFLHFRKSNILKSSVNESEIIDISDQSTFPVKNLKRNEYFVIHHTAGRGTAQDVIKILNKRDLSVQWIVDREGRIHRGLPPNSLAYHAGRDKSKDLMPEVQNSNSQGVEVIGLDDNDIKQQFDSDIAKYGYPRQAEAVRRIIKYLGYPKQNIVGHGEITTTKQKTEGKTIKDYVIANWDKPIDLSGFSGPDLRVDPAIVQVDRTNSQDTNTGSPSTPSYSIDSAVVVKLIEALKRRDFPKSGADASSNQVPRYLGGGKISEANLKVLYDTMDEYGVTNKYAREAILGVISKESSTAQSEISYESTPNSRIRTTFGSRVAGLSDSELNKLKADPEKFFNKVYANINGNGDEASGDGYRYRGRGFNGITGKGLYAELQKEYKGSGINIVTNPELLENPEVAAKFAIIYFVRSFRKRNKPINSYTNIEDAVRDFVQANHGMGHSIDDSEIGREGYAKALAYAKSRLESATAST